MAEHRPVARRVAADIEAVRADQDLTARVADLVERDQEILDRLGREAMVDQAIDDVTERYSAAIERLS